MHKAGVDISALLDMISSLDLASGISTMMNSIVFHKSSFKWKVMRFRMRRTGNAPSASPRRSRFVWVHHQSRNRRMASRGALRAPPRSRTERCGWCSGETERPRRRSYLRHMGTPVHGQVLLLRKAIEVVWKDDENGKRSVGRYFCLCMQSVDNGRKRRDLHLTLPSISFSC